PPARLDLEVMFAWAPAPPSLLLELRFPFRPLARYDARHETGRARCAAESTVQPVDGPRTPVVEDTSSRSSAMCLSIGAAAAARKMTKKRSLLRGESPGSRRCSGSRQSLLAPVVRSAAVRRRSVPMSELLPVLLIGGLAVMAVAVVVIRALRQPSQPN